MHKQDEQQNPISLKEVTKEIKDYLLSVGYPNKENIYYVEVWLWLWKEKGVRISVDYTQATNDIFDCWTKLNEEHIKELDCTVDEPELAIENTIKYLVQNDLIK